MRTAAPLLGTKGDVLLVDPMQYILLTKGTAKQDWSIHVEFLTDQNCFRMVFRCNGAPKVNKALTIKNSSKLRSPFCCALHRKEGRINMNRICEEVQYLDVFAPQAVATATKKDQYLCGHRRRGQRGILDLHRRPHQREEADGGRPDLRERRRLQPGGCGKMVFTASGSTPGLAVVSYRVRGDRGRYVGVTFQHDAGSEVDCAVLAAVRPMYRPPENSWQLVV